MPVSPDRSEVEASAKRICTHKLFANSSVYSRLLQYLVEKHYEKEDLKEYTIASELFERKHKSGDATVRTYMYNLRKRLAGFYDDKNTNESFRFVIPKGQYNLSFETTVDTRSSTPQQPKKKIQLHWLWFLGVISVLAIVGFYNFTENKSFPCWEKFFDENSRNILTISDQFIVSGSNQSGEIRHQIISQVKNSEDLVTHIKQHPEESLKQANYTVMTKMAPYSVKELTKWFSIHRADFSLLLESDLKFEDIRNNNILFIGQQKTMDFSLSLFLKDSDKFKPELDGYSAIGEDGSVKTYKTIYDQDEKIEYAMVSFSTFVQGKDALYFVSNHDIGVMALVRNFTNEKWLESFYNSHPTNTRYFNALFEVSGIHRNDVSCKLVEFEPLESKQ